MQVGSTQLYRFLIDNLNSALLLLSDDLTVEYLNPAFEALLKVSSSRLNGCPASALFRDGSNVMQSIQTSLATGRPFTRRHEFLDCYSTEPIKVDYSVIPVELGSESKLLMELQPIDRFLKINREEAMLSVQDTSKTLIRGLAHEIKNPLTPMRLSVQSFQQKFDPDDPKIHKKVEEYSKTLIQQIDTMSSIASAFSNFAEMPTQQGEKLNIVKAVRLSLEIFKEKHIVFESENDKLIVVIDRPQIVRIMTNLIKNAVQACESIKSPTIKVSIKKLSKSVRIIVKDNGAGIPENIRKNIFQPNFTTKSGGMGLGLGMVKNLVNSYEGKIDFESKINKGTSFRITFPLSD